MTEEPRTIEPVAGDLKALFYIELLEEADIPCVVKASFRPDGSVLLDGHVGRIEPFEKLMPLVKLLEGEDVILFLTDVEEQRVGVISVDPPRGTSLPFSGSDIKAVIIRLMEGEWPERPVAEPEPECNTLPPLWKRHPQQIIKAVEDMKNEGILPEWVSKAAISKAQQLEYDLGDNKRMLRSALKLLLDTDFRPSPPDVPSMQELKRRFSERFLGEELQPAKEIILDLLHEIRATGSIPKAYTIVLTGPAGVGKTSLAKWVAEQLGIWFLLVDVPTSEAEEISGSAALYANAKPSGVAAQIIQTGSSQGCILLNEIDAIMHDRRGTGRDKMLLSLLDHTETFMDHALELVIPTDNLLILGTANSLEGLPTPLRDRIVEVYVPPYKESTKREILRKHTLPHLCEEMDWSVALTKKAEDVILAHAADSSGARGVEQTAGILLRRGFREKRSVIDGEYACQILGSAPPENTVVWHYGMANVVVPQTCGMRIPVSARLVAGGSGKIRYIGPDTWQKEAETAACAALLDLERQSEEPVMCRTDVILHCPVPAETCGIGVAVYQAVMSAASERSLPSDLLYIGATDLQGNLLFLHTGGAAMQFLRQSVPCGLTIAGPVGTKAFLREGAEVVESLSARGLFDRIMRSTQV